LVNHGLARPGADLVTGRSVTVNRANILANENRSGYRWGGYYPAYSYYPYSYSYYPYSAYSPDSSDPSPYTGSYPSGDSNRPSGSQSNPGATGSPSQPGSASPAPSQEGAASTDKVTAAARRCMDQARLAFQKGAYAEAQAECEPALRLLPGDANLHEFQALCQFAQGKYPDAAGTLYEVLAAGPGWDWDTLRAIYTSAQTYTTHLRALERYVSEHPKDPAGRFVLAYHYLALDEGDAAASQLREVIKLQPRDQVAPAILEALEKAKAPKDEAPPRPPKPGL
jgi:tetratricopeptide (TPR) repeat protein